MGLLDTWREVRQQIIDSKPTYEPFITPKEYVSPFYADTPEAEVAAAPVAAAPVYDQGLLYKRRLPPLNEDPITDFAVWQTPPSPYEPVETTEQLTKLMGQTPMVNALSAILPGGVLMNAAQRSQVQNAANRIFGPALQGGPFGFKDIIPFFGGDYEARIRNTINQYSPEAITARWANYSPVVEPLSPPEPSPIIAGGGGPAGQYYTTQPQLTYPPAGQTGDWDDQPSYDPSSASFVDWDE